MAEPSIVNIRASGLGAYSKVSPKTGLAAIPGGAERLDIAAITFAIGTPQRGETWASD
jgi:hypothetical protein